MKRITLLALSLAATLATAAAQDSKVEFDWAFVRRGPGDSISPLDFKEKVSIAEGDLFKIYLRPVVRCAVYVFLHDAAGGLELIYPARFADLEAAPNVGKAVFIPEGDDWFTLDGNRGTETFHLIAAPARLAELEGAYTRYRGLADGKAAPDEAARARQAVLDEMARLRKKHSALAAAAERPVTIAGGTRAIEDEIRKRATRVASAAFYSRTFRLEH